MSSTSPGPRKMTGSTMMRATVMGTKMTGAERRGPRSLAEMALKVVLQNASDITDVGSLPPVYTSMILKAVKTAAHLHTLELNSDDIYDQTPEHWERLIRRDFPILAARHKYKPPNPQSWYRVYERYKKLEDDAVATATAKLSQGFAAVKEHRDSRQSTIVSGAQAKQLPKPKMGRYVKPKPRHGCKTWLDQARKESKEHARSFAIAKPRKWIMPIQKQIREAPEWMIREARERRLAAEAAEKATEKAEVAEVAEKTKATEKGQEPVAPALQHSKTKKRVESKKRVGSKKRLEHNNFVSVVPPSKKLHRS